MWHSLTLGIRVLAIIAGLVLIYAALFLYEDEQGKVQSTLEDLWLRIDEQRRAFLSRHAAFMREVARLANVGFDRLFGKKLFSWQALAVSSCYSIASVCLILAYNVYRYDRLISADRKIYPNLLNSLYSEEYGRLLLPGLIIFTVVLLLLGTLPALISNFKLRRTWFFGVIVLDVTIASTLFLWEYLGWVAYLAGRRQLFKAGAVGGIGHTSLLWENMVFGITESLLRRWDFRAIMLIAFFAGIALGVTSDLAFVAITRRLLRWSSHLESFVRISCVVLLNFVLALVLGLGPAVVGYTSTFIILGRWGPLNAFPDDAFPISSLELLSEGLRQLGFVASLSNVITAFSATIFVALAAAMLLHKILWPLLERPVYSLQRFGIARRSKLLGSLGVMLIGVGAGIMPLWLKEIVEKLNP